MCSTGPQISFRNLRPAPPVTRPGRTRAPSRTCTRPGSGRTRFAKPPDSGSRPFRAIRRRVRVAGPAHADDLGRASTRTAPIHPRSTGVGPGGDGLDPCGRPCRSSVGRRVRLRLDGPRWHGRGGGRGRRPLAHSPVFHPDPHPDADPYAEPHTDADTDPHTSTETTADAETRTAPSPTAPRGAATTAGAGPGATAAPATAGPAPLAPAEPAPVGDSRALPPVPLGVPAAPSARRSLTADVHPAHRRARGIRRRRAASALTPGGTSCRNGLFSPSRWRPPVPSWSR